METERLTGKTASELQSKLERGEVVISPKLLSLVEKSERLSEGEDNKRIRSLEITLLRRLSDRESLKDLSNMDLGLIALTTSLICYEQRKTLRYAFRVGSLRTDLAAALSTINAELDRRIYGA